MRILYLQKPKGIKWFQQLPKSEQYPRHCRLLEDLEIQLSDGYILKIPKGYIWDGASVPSWLHWLFPPVDEGVIGDLIHDRLWEDKQGQFEYFKFNIYKARKFADDERRRWRKVHAPKKWVFNWISHAVIRAIGGLYYSRQLKIPK